jgi:hypothetical protein
VGKFGRLRYREAVERRYQDLRIDVTGAGDRDKRISVQQVT